jgi:hypothetical protein
MSVCKVCIFVVFVNFSHGAQLSAQVESQMFGGPNPNAVFAAIKLQIEGTGALPENADINRELYDDQALAWDEITKAVQDSWRPAFTGSGTTGSSSGSVVAISDKYILKSEDSSFYANFQKIKDSYLDRASNANSCLQKIRGVYRTGTVSYTYWFLIENSNKHAAGRNQFRFDMKASRQIGKSSGFTGAAGKLGFTDDFFYLKDLQSWTYTQPLTQQDGRNTAVRKAIQDDLQIFANAWTRSVDPIQLVDFSILVFVNSIPADDEDYDSPSNCVQFTRVNPATGAAETFEMCFSVIDFFAHLSWSKKLGQKADQIKVYGQHNKFNKNYALRLDQLMGDMLADTTTVRNIVRHYVPQARQRFQKHAMDLAAQYRKTTLVNRSFEAFADTYYRSNPHGLPKVILQPLYKICAYGLSERVNVNLPKFIENFNVTSGKDDEALHKSRAKFVAHMWALVEKKVASMGASGRLARINTAQMFNTKYEQLKPRIGKPVNQARGGAVKLNRDDVLQLNRNRAQLIR